MSANLIGRFWRNILAASEAAVAVNYCAPWKRSAPGERRRVSSR